MTERYCELVFVFYSHLVTNIYSSNCDVLEFSEHLLRLFYHVGLICFYIARNWLVNVSASLFCLTAFLRHSEQNNSIMQKLANKT